MASTTPRTILRAIPSTASSRIAPSIPTADTTWAPLVAAILRTRQRALFVYTAAFAWACAGLWAAAARPSVGSLFLLPFRPTTLGVALGVWALGAVPVLVLRKLHVRDAPGAAVSPRTAFEAATALPGAVRDLVVYAASAMAALFLQMVVAYAEGAHDPRIGIFGHSKKYPLHLNGRFVYMLFTQLALAAAFLARDAIRDRLPIRWSHSASVPNKTDVLILLPKVLVPTAVFAIATLVLSTLAFGLLRALVLPVVLRLPVFRPLLKPFVGLFLRPRNGWTVFLPFRHVGLIARTLLLGTSTASTWELASALFDAFVSADMEPASLSATPTLALISGTSASADDLRFPAYASLARLASDGSAASAAARTQLFGDQKYNPSMWAVLVREGLLLLGTDYQRLLGRGKLPEKAAAPAPAPAPKPKPQDLPKAKELLQTPIFKSSSAARSPLRVLADGLGANGELAAAVDEAAAKTEHALPELFRSVRGDVVLERAGVAGAIESARAVVDGGAERAVAVVKAVPASGGEVKGVLAWAVGSAKQAAGAYVPPAVGAASSELERWWTEERVVKVAEACLPRREMDVLVIKTLTHLVCASLEEDRYGVVQRDIPRILEALLSFLTAVDAYATELAAKRVPLTPEATKDMSEAQLAAQVKLNEQTEQAGAVVAVVGDALRRYWEDREEVRGEAERVQVPTGRGIEIAGLCGLWALSVMLGAGCIDGRVSRDVWIIYQ